ncbi:M3 family oligoendopeptidase [Bacillus toyonensis]|uniref:M3 family oligoendopeptidase n=1 Tax=Bacillus toyonensis TaxID=155322 RepID=UPI000BF46714|nr:M3 family oligoendopeptidase [Bacillus toyonensis]PGA43610.1 pantothenate kinase [Bacillus toyonensis]PGC32761.1 pantothenate kinase [Bacillus toyonensis]
MSETKYRQVWNLDSLFLGGSESSQLHEHIRHLEIEISEFEKKTNSFNVPKKINESINVAVLIEYIGDIRTNISQANSFITCLLAQSPKDQHAIILQGKITIINTRFESALKKVKNTLVKIDYHLWQGLLNTDVLANYNFILNEWREDVETNLSDEEQNLVSDLMVDGYHAWGQFYNSFMNNITIKVQINGEQKKLSVGQAINLRSHPNEEVRKESHNALEDTWKENEELFAKILNHIAGFRLQVYKKCGLDNVIQESLIKNRMKEETLHAMWSVVNKFKKPFTDYLNQKAKINGYKKMKSFNFWAPITTKNQKIEYEDAVNFILEHFSEFGTELEDFSKKAFSEGWIEVEDRANKSAVAFCSGFPLSKESRVFMTFGGTITDVLTLAHELGHAFHNDAMKSIHGMNKQYPMCIAETASTFSEMIILDAAMQKAKSTNEKLFLLDEKLKRSVMNFMNIHSRFLFEKKFYEERKEGIVSSSRLNEIMQEAIDKGYDGSLDNPSLHSWIWTPHYYITQSPFYNFPYSFGYLFALSLFAKAKEKGKEFERYYLDLLRDSGSMCTEDLVMKHLGEDITSESFWKKGIELCIKDVDEFIKLTSS